MHHVAQRADAVVVARPALDSERLAHGDLDLVDVRGVEHRFDEPVRKSEHEHVLHGLFTEEVVDAKDLVFAPVPVHLFVQCDRGLEIDAKRLFDDEPAPPVGLVGEPGLRDRLGRVREHAGRKREVEDRGPVEHAVQAAQRLDRDVAAVKVDAVDEPVDVLRIDILVDRVHVDRRAQVLVELLGGPLLTGVTDDLEVLETVAVLQREQRREQKPGREVARSAEHDERGLVAHQMAPSLRHPWLRCVRTSRSGYVERRMWRERSPTSFGSKTRSAKCQRSWVRAKRSRYSPARIGCSPCPVICNTVK